MESKKSSRTSEKLAAKTASERKASEERAGAGEKRAGTSEEKNKREKDKARQKRKERQREQVTTLTFKPNPHWTRARIGTQIL